MLVYLTLDILEEKQKLKAVSRSESSYTEPTYMGLIQEQFIHYYQLDIYGYISNTNYKYLIVKNEAKTTVLGQKPSDLPIKNVKNYFF